MATKNPCSKETTKWFAFSQICLQQQKNTINFLFTIILNSVESTFTSRAIYMYNTCIILKVVGDPAPML